MTWEELCEKARMLGYELNFDDDGIENLLLDPYKNHTYLMFYIDGRITFDFLKLSKKRTPEQMYAIMEALR